MAVCEGFGGRVAKGVPWLIALIIVGMLGAFVSCIVSDAVPYYPDRPGQSLPSWLLLVLTGPEVLAEYASSFAMFLVFGALGTFGVLRTLTRQNARPGQASG